MKPNFKKNLFSLSDIIYFVRTRLGFQSKMSASLEVDAIRDINSMTHKKIPLPKSFDYDPLYAVAESNLWFVIYSVLACLTAWKIANKFISQFFY